MSNTKNATLEKVFFSHLWNKSAKMHFFSYIVNTYKKNTLIIKVLKIKKYLQCSKRMKKDKTTQNNGRTKYNFNINLKIVDFQQSKYNFYLKKVKRFHDCFQKENNNTILLQIKTSFIKHRKLYITFGKGVTSLNI